MGQYPENMISVVEEPASHVDLVEMDVVRYGSEELVAFHDDDPSRLMTAAGRLDETAVDDLMVLHVGGSRATIPRFDQVVEAWPAGTDMNLDTHDPGLAKDALAAVERLDERAVSSSPSREAVGIALETPTPAEVGCPLRDDMSAESMQVAEQGCEFVHAEHGPCTPSNLMEHAHDAGLLVDAQTVDDETTAATPRSFDMDAPTVDRWDAVTPGAYS